jgi:hypothetical protein
MKPRDLPNPSAQIDRLIAKIPDWRGTTFARVRKVIRDADPEIVEEFKWMGSPVWSRDGMIAVANAFKGRVNVTFAYGASLPDGQSTFSRTIRSTNLLSRRSFAPRSNTIKRI